MGYYRHIVAPRLPVEVVSLALDQNRAVLRFLTSLSSADEVRQRKCGNIEDLRTTARLAAPFVPVEAADVFYEINGRRWVIFAEGILDKRVAEYSRLWVPGTH